MEQGDPPSVQLLLRHGASVNASWLVPDVGVVLSPVSLAAFAGQLEIVSMLIEAGASVNSADKVLIVQCHLVIHQIR